MAKKLQPAPDYAVDLPEPHDIGQRLASALEKWESRNNFIENARKFLDGKNEVLLPRARTYRPVARRTYKLLGYQNQVIARLGHLPRIAAVGSGESDAQADIAQDVEQWVNEAFSELNRRSGRVWTRAIGDAAILGEGIVCVERAPAAFWPELVPADDGSEPLRKKLEKSPELVALFQSDPEAYTAAREEYKRQAGLNQRWRYVALENWFPELEGDTAVATFELEPRSLREVLSNPNFDTEQIESGLSSAERANRTKEQVTILRFANARYYAFYALTTTGSGIQFPSQAAWVAAQGGMPVLLQATEHKLGRPPYARLPGRGGGWNQPENIAEQITGALMEMNAYLDELASQAATNVRVRYWPTTVTKYSREARGWKPGQRMPARNVAEGGDIALFTDESVELLFDGYDDPTLRFYWEKTEADMAMLGGAPALFGQGEAGVHSGYEQELQISQSESLYEMVEEGASIGAVAIARLVLDHVRATKEPTPVQVTGERDDGRTYSKYLTLDPKKLDPIPRLDAQVTKPRPTDWVAMIRAALDVTAPTGQDGTPLMSKRWAREHLLNIEDPSSAERQIRIEQMEAQAISQGVLSEMVLTALRLVEVQAGVPKTVSPAMAEDADPALLGTVQDMASGGPAGQPGSGGISPEVLNSVEQATGGRRTGGTPPGQSTPESVLGQQVASVVRTGQAPVP